MVKLDLQQFRDKHLPAAEFVERAFTALDEIPDDVAMHMRTGDVKKLVEEILPIAVFARRFDTLERRVHCRHLGASDDDADAELVLSGRTVDRGFYPQQLLVEATCAEDKKAYLRREALARHGGVFTGGNIEAVGRRNDATRRIESRPEVREGDSGPELMASVVREAIERKAAKNYNPARVLIVRVDPDFPVTDRRIARVVNAANLNANYPGLLGIFLVDCSTATVMQTWSQAAG